MVLASTQFINALRQADSEKLIEAIYHEELRKGINNLGGRVQGIKTMYDTDGVLDGEFDFDGTTKVFRIIIETKQDETFSNVVVRSKVLAQVIYYLKRFEEAGDEIPNIIFVGDRNECFVVHSNYLQGYLEKSYNWSISPSRAGVDNPELVKALVEDVELVSQCFVYVIDDNFDFSEVMQKIYSLALEIKVHVRITERSISKVFDYFSMRVLKRKSSGESKYTAREQVEFFMHLVLNQDDCYVHPRKRNRAVLRGTEVDVDVQAFESFINHYEFNYNAEEKKDFTAIADRLIEDSDRRRKGDFYTPSVWVDEAHKMLSEKLGGNWKDEYVVWDCAWGTGNLTRDYRFWDLYCSTLHDHDLKIGEKYNQDATKFQYDFLNDDVELFDELLSKVQGGYRLTERDFYGSKLWQSAPNLVRGILNGKKLLFFINPPYGTSASYSVLSAGSSEVQKHKTGISETKVRDILIRDGGGLLSRNLYAQFIYRIVKISNLFNTQMSLALFSPIDFLTSSGADRFRELLRGEMRFVSAFVLQASNFADVASNWGIAFSLIDLGDYDDPLESFKVDVKEFTSGGVTTIGTKVLYNVDNGVTSARWIREGLSGDRTKNGVYVRSALVVADKPGYASIYEGALGSVMNNCNRVNENNQTVAIFSGVSSNAAAVCITEGNYYNAISNFTARRLISGPYATWVNWQDEYMKPNTDHPLYQQWVNDCTVYSLFDGKSNQSSLRGVEFNGGTRNIYNEFFFMSRDEMRQLALGDNPNDEVYYDLEHHAEEERFVYRKLQGVTLSPDAQRVLEYAKHLVRESFKYRDLFNQEYPEYHINTWDAGWYQIRGILRTYMPEEMGVFHELFKEFSNRMRPLVVELGFLYDYPGYKEERKTYLEGYYLKQYN